MSQPEPAVPPEDRKDRKRLTLAFAAALLLHASFALAFVTLTPEPVSPPGEMVVTVDLAPAVASSAAEPIAGQSAQSVPQQPSPPEPEPKPDQDTAEKQPLPETNTAEDQIAEPPPPAETAEVAIAPKKKETAERKPKPKPPAPQQAASSVREQRADIGGSGARASPSEIAQYIGRVRAAIERNKHYPAAAGGAEGLAHIAFTVTKSGAVTGLRVTRSSGNPVLDSAARSAVASADIPPIPEGLPGSMNLGAPISFRVR